MSNDLFPIPAGYLVEVESWENDADNYITKYVKGLTEKQAAFITRFAKLFESSNSRGDTSFTPLVYAGEKGFKHNPDCIGGYGNFKIPSLYRPKEALSGRALEERRAYYRLIDLVRSILIDVGDGCVPEDRDINVEWWEKDLSWSSKEQLEELVSDLQYEIIGTWNEGDNYRVVESVRVYHFPVDVSPTLVEDPL